MEFSFTDFIELVQNAIAALFGPELAPIILKIVYVAILLIALIFIVYVPFYLVTQFIRLIKQEVIPLFYDESRRRFRDRRRRFAQHLRDEINKLNRLESWTDFRFTELEAEVEFEGSRVSGFLPRLLFRGSTTSGLDREKSLSRALRSSDERLILLEGHPGSGKSVALRHVALKLCQKAENARDLAATIPVYVNLKHLERPKNEPINRQLIYDFVWNRLNSFNDADIERFLEDSFDKGIQEGTWLFLFDSFDEIPEILSSVEADSIINEYADAIGDFLAGMNSCRGVVASREYRGPNRLGWPKFRILPLSEKRQKQLIAKADLPNIDTNHVVGQLYYAPEGIRAMSSNPMFLGLVCDFIKHNNDFPQNSFSVYEQYVQVRLERDSERLTRRFSMSPNQLRDTAEKVAFCMAIDPDIGLSPDREKLKQALSRHSLDIAHDFDKTLDALEFIKLARSESENLPGTYRYFTFAHRRFQEYFATSVVLREPDRVSADMLLLDGIWREPAVVILQTQGREVLESLLNSAEQFISQAMSEVPFTDKGLCEPVKPSPFPWPPKILHVLGLLQEGLINRSDIVLSSGLQKLVASLFNSAYSNGTRIDRKLVLQNAAVADSGSALKFIRAAFDSGSLWLRGFAFRQTANLTTLPEDFNKTILQAVFDLAMSDSLVKQQNATKIHLLRLSNSKLFIGAFNLLVHFRKINFTLQILTILLNLILFRTWIFFVQVTSGSPTQNSANVFLVVVLGFLQTTILATSIVRLGWAIWHSWKGSYFQTFYNRNKLFTPFSVLWYSFSVLVFLLFESIPFLLLAGISIILLFAELWPLEALINAKMGKFTIWYWWPFYIWVTVPIKVFGAIRDFSRVLALIIKWIRKQGKIGFIIIGISSFFVIAIFIIIGAVKVESAFLSSLGDSIRFWAGIFSILGLIILSFVALYKFVVRMICVVQIRNFKRSLNRTAYLTLSARQIIYLIMKIDLLPYSDSVLIVSLFDKLKKSANVFSRTEYRTLFELARNIDYLITREKFLTDLASGQASDFSNYLTDLMSDKTGMSSHQIQLTSYELDEVMKMRWLSMIDVPLLGEEQRKLVALVKEAGRKAVVSDNLPRLGFRDLFSRNYFSVSSIAKDKNYGKWFKLYRGGVLHTDGVLLTDESVDSFYQFLEYVQTNLSEG